MGHVGLGQGARGSGALRQGRSPWAAFAQELISRSRFSHVNRCKCRIVPKRALQVTQPAWDSQRTHLGKALGKNLASDYCHWGKCLSVSVYGNNNANLNQRECHNQSSPHLQNFKSQSCWFEAPAATLKAQSECDGVTELG